MRQNLDIVRLVTGAGPGRQACGDRRARFAAAGFAALVAFAALTWLACALGRQSADLTWVAPVIGAAMASAMAMAVVLTNSLLSTREAADRLAFWHLFERAGDAAFRFDAHGAVVAVSESAQTFFGARSYDLTASGLLERVHVRDRSRYQAAMSDVRATGSGRSIELRVRRDDVSARAVAPRFAWTEVSLSAVADPDRPGAHREVVAVLRDIGIARAMAEELRLARQTAEDARKAASHLQAMISHELRAPLSAIVGFSELLAAGSAGDAPSDQRQYANLIMHAGRQLSELIDMLLEGTRLPSGGLALHLRTFAPEALVGPCLQLFAKAAADRRVSIEIDTPADLPALTADEQACRRMLIELLSNALKFSRRGGAVKLAMRRQGSNLRISVSDRGVGMTPEDMDRVGEPLLTAGDSDARAAQEGGRGLSVVRSLAGLHGGSLRVVSELGYGTTASVLLPINGPETKSDQTDTPTPIHREEAMDEAPEPAVQWPDRKRSAR